MTAAVRRFAGRRARWAMALLIAATAVMSAPDPATADDDDQPPQIVGGVPADVGEFPWMVRLSVGCGGSVYRAWIVLTAAHCVHDTGPAEDIEVLAGHVDLDEARLRARATYAHRPDGFDGARHGRDWALLLLDRPMYLPSLPLSGTPVTAGPLTTMGWGDTDPSGESPVRWLRKAEVEFVPDDQCAAAYHTANVPIVADEMLCAAAPGADSCFGDSGGALIHRPDSGRPVQVGIVSWGRGCASPFYPGVYTEVATFAADIAAAADALEARRFPR